MDKKVTITMEHPDAKDGVLKFCTEDGYELILCTGNHEKESNQYHFQRMLATNGHLLEEMIKSLLRDFPDVFLKIMMEDTIEKMKNHMKDKDFLLDEPGSKIPH